MELNNLRLLVNKFADCFDFYKNQLRLTVNYGDEKGPYASFDLGELSQLALFNADMMSETVATKELEYPENFKDKFVIVIEVESVDKTFEKLSEKGVKFINEPMDMEGWGIRVSHLRDPENNLVELFTPLDEN